MKLDNLVGKKIRLPFEGDPDIATITAVSVGKKTTQVAWKASGRAGTVHVPRGLLNYLLVGKKA